MRKFAECCFCLLATMFLVFAVSCAGKPAVRQPPGPADVLPLEDAPPEAIMGKGKIPARELSGFLRENNPDVEGDFAESLAGFYVEEAALEGVNHDVAFAQMCLETGFLRFGGLVRPEMNNFCGLGAISAERPGESFDSPKTGVRAHIQHLKAYATEAPLNQALVDPRYRWVRKGSAPEISGLAGSWATDSDYAGKIRAILVRLYGFSRARRK